MSDPDPSRQPPSIQDVAKAAGVSTATVSRVLNNPSLVAAATAERVQEAIRDLGYRPNLLAQGLMTRRSRVLGIALPDIHGEFYSALLRGADAEAHRLGYHLLVSSEALNGRAPNLGGSIAFGLINGLVLMVTEPNEALWREARQLGLPIVALDAEKPEDDVDAILIDSASGTREAMVHLLDGTPPQRCYFVGGPPENYDTRRRCEMFRTCLAEAGSPARAEQITYGDYSVDWGARWVGQMIEGGADLRGAAVLAGDDEIALGIMRAAEDGGLRVPHDLRLVGFDDTRIASLVRPALSSVTVPLSEVGSATIRTLVDRIDNPKTPPVRVSISTALVIRESSAVA